ncbi:MAG TPA: GreA/GreB family elongation factor [Fulvivirga sp.]|nr:GreA/GreB family elongation factor [Fulvivirga sp.]
MKRRLITFTDFTRLNVIRDRTSLKSNKFDVLEQFYNELDTAAIFPPGHISSKVVTMNSTVLLKDLRNGEEFELTITYPHFDARGDKNISIYHPIGMALLGRMERDEVTWNTPEGFGRYEILKVVYQPEAVGVNYV